jgi:hypothetical protein
MLYRLKLRLFETSMKQRKHYLEMRLDVDQEGFGGG